MKHPLFQDSFDLKLDEKNRLFVPVDVRECIKPERDGDFFYCIVGLNQKIWLYTEKWFEELAAQQQLNRFPTEHDMAFNQLWYGLTSKLKPWDSNGRILVPEKMLKPTDTGKEVTIVGCFDHLELWNREEWAARKAELERKRGEITLRAQLSRTASQPAPMTAPLG